MKIAPSTILFFAGLLAGSLVHAAEDDHDHDHGHDHGHMHHCGSCACAAEEHGFAIDCSNQAAMQAAEAALAANNCETNCNSEVCKRNFLIIQTHHDFCYVSELPDTLEDSLHIHESGCEEYACCNIIPKFDSSKPTCAAVACDDSGNQAHAALTASNCISNCTSDMCGENYRTLMMVHDTCPENTLTLTAEAMFHEVENECDKLHGCNLPGANASTDQQQLVCVAETSAGAAFFKAVGLAITTVAGLVVLMM